MCLDHLMWTVYLVWCCIAVVSVPALHRYSLQLPLTDDSCDPPTYCGHCNTLLWEWAQSLAMPVGAHLQSMFSPVPLRACFLLPLLSVVPFLIFLLSTIVKSAPPSCTASVDCDCSCVLSTTLANEWAVGEGGRGGVDG